MGGIISGRKIHKSFGALKVLRGIDIEVERGAVVSIVGRSGAGKTTLLQILGTLARPDGQPRASIAIDGAEVNALGDRELSAFRNRNIGFIFQFHQLLPEFSALENAALPALIAGENKKTAREKARELLCFLKLEARMHHRPEQLSGGEQQRVAVARALVNHPGVILADEPSGNLDSRCAAELHELFFKLRAAFTQTFVIVTHNTELAEMADRKIEMEDGLIRSD